MVDEVDKEDEIDRESVLAVVDDRKSGGKSSVEDKSGGVGKVHEALFGGEIGVLEELEPRTEE